MKKIAVFICNVQDIINCKCLNEYDANKIYMELQEILDLIRIKSNSDKMFCSLICGSREPKLLEGIQKISPYFEGTDIELNTQYSYKHGFNSDGDAIMSFIKPDEMCKVEKIIYHIQLLMDHYDITWIGFADDTYCNFNEAKRRLNEAFPNIEVQTFCPSEIESLNQELASYLGIRMSIIDENLPSEDEWLNFNNSKIKTLKDVTNS